MITMLKVLGFVFLALLLMYVGYCTALLEITEKEEVETQLKRQQELITIINYRI